MASKSSTNAGPLTLALAAAAVLFAALALWLYLTNQEPGDGSVEAGFARDMSVHHAQAVEMAGIIRDKTSNEEIEILATDVILTQQGQIGQMQGWLAVWGLSPTGTEPTMSWMGMPTEGRMPGMASPEEVGRLRELPPGEADKEFLRLLITHHRAAIPMAEAAMEGSDRPEVERLAEAISESQQSEMRAMQDLLRRLGGEPPPAGDGMDMPM